MDRTDQRFVRSTVLLSGDSMTLRTRNGEVAIEAALRLLLRICPNTSVAVPDGHGELASHLRMVAAHCAFGAPIPFVRAARPEEFDAVLHVGASRTARATVAVNSNGWLARVASGPLRIDPECTRTNPIAATFAAGIGVAEVFKRLLPVKATRARPLGAVEFNLLSYSVEDRDPGPNVPMIRLPRSVLVGAGAIGNGLTYVLHQLPVVCHLDLVDYQVFGDENLGICMLIGPSDLGWPKADVLSRFARAGLRIEPHAQYLKAFTERLGQEVRHPAIALSAVDSVITRYAIQDMWPGLVINGAIGDFPLEVSLHRWGENVACMRCIYQELAGERSEAILSRETGLPSEMLEDLDSPLTEAMVGSLPESLCVLLRPHVGKRMCAVVNEPGLRKIAHGAPEPGFEPSVPFVAAMSGAMMAGEFVKQGMGIGSRLAPRFQMDALVGPEAGQFFDEERRGGCICVARRDAIDRARAARRAS